MEEINKVFYYFVYYFHIAYALKSAEFLPPGVTGSADRKRVLRPALPISGVA
jgi:hypothetical protein